MTRESRPFSICYLQGTGVEMSTKTITLWGVNCCGATFLKKKKSYRCERQATASTAEMFFIVIRTH